MQPAQETQREVLLKAATLPLEGLLVRFPDSHSVEFQTLGFLSKKVVEQKKETERQDPDDTRWTLLRVCNMMFLR